MVVGPSPALGRGRQSSLAGAKRSHMLEAAGLSPISPNSDSVDETSWPTILRLGERKGLFGVAVIAMRPM